MLITKLSKSALGCAVVLCPLVGCSTNEEERDEEEPHEAAAAELGPQRQFDHDFEIPMQSVPLQKTFTDALSSYGLTMRPTLTASGVFGFADGHVHVQAEYTGAHVTRLDVSASGDWFATARIDLDVMVNPAWATYSADVRKRFITGTSVGGKAMEIGKVPLGAVPLPQAPGLELAVELELAVACELDFDADLHARAELGVGGLASIDAFYDEELPNKVGVVANAGLTPAERFHVTTSPRFSFGATNRASVHGRCSIEPSINAMVANLGSWAFPVADVGVKVIVEPYAELTGTFRSQHDWSAVAKVGVEANISPFGDFFGRHWEHTKYVTLFDYELARRSTQSR